MENGIPRRAYIEHRTKEETLIKEVIEKIENLGSDRLLTDAIVLLDRAFNKLADFNDKEMSK